MNWTLVLNSLLVSGIATAGAVGGGFFAALWLAGLEARWWPAFFAAAVAALDMAGDVFPGVGGVAAGTSRPVGGGPATARRGAAALAVAAAGGNEPDAGGDSDVRAGPE